uniref:Uncharacterized protein n=1 Tax=Onchocerca volvulus TaxID=6282 RepID=A0A8R1U0L8_ONCVO
MIARTWKFAEEKEILFVLWLIFLCFIAINSAPINMTPTELANRFTDCKQTVEYTEQATNHHKWHNKWYSCFEDGSLKSLFYLTVAIIRASDLTRTGLIYCNSATKTGENPGSVYAIVGYKKF